MATAETLEVSKFYERGSVIDYGGMLVVGTEVTCEPANEAAVLFAGELATNSEK